MSFQSELSSWLATTGPKTSEPPKIGSKAPSTSKLLMPPKDGKPVLVTFLRHCGCPFAEKTYLSLRTAARSRPNITFIAISHSSASATSHWSSSLPPVDPTNPSTPNPPNLQLIADEERHIFAAWGVGISSFWHVLNPTSLWSVYKLGKEEGIWNRPTESGSRWQMSGSWGVDREGYVRWGGVSGRADEIPVFEEGVRAVLGET